MNKTKIISLASIMFCLLIIMPIAFAGENQTDLMINETLQSDDDSESLLSSDYYFDAKNDDGGNGSDANPYKEFNSKLIKNDSNVHFDNGEYNLGNVKCNNVTFIGVSPYVTVLSNGNLEVSGSISLQNIALKNITLINNGNVIASNVVMNLGAGNYDLGSIKSSSLTINGVSSSKTILTKGTIDATSDLTFNYLKVDGMSINNKGGVAATDSIFNFADSTYKLGTVNSYNLTIIGQSALKTILNGGKITVSTLLTIKNIALNKIPISNYGNIAASNTIFDSSSSSTYGGAIYSTGTSAHIDLNNCTFSNNHAAYGGAIYMVDGILDIRNSVFTNNYATYYGGAIVSDNANVTVKKSRFNGNYALNDAGGSFYLIDSNLVANSLSVTSSNATFGGAITSLKSNLNLNNFTATANNAKYDGGALYMMYGELVMGKSTFTSNSASNGGALFMDEISDVNVTRTKFTKNTASNTGGAAYSIISEYLVPISISDKLFSNTFSSNTALVANDVYDSYLPDLEIGGGDYTLIKNDNYYDGELPAKYDLRQLNQVTPVKAQGSGGNCWAFASLAALESCILKATGTTYDLSEENMKNVMSLFSDYGWAMEPNKGGYDKMGVGYLTSWLGPINDADDKYNANSALSSVFDSIMHVQNTIHLTRTNYTDNDEIKYAIMNYGAVATSIYWSSSYAKGSSYYYSGNLSANHAVVIVGWDDTYSRNNFKTKPVADGAWIIKNSWGTGSGDKGYYYVSYYDARCLPLNKPDSTYTFILNDTMRYDRNYQYDIPGRTDYFLNSSSTVWYKNKFTSTGREYLAAVSTYFEKNTDWTLSVYVNNALKLTKSGFSKMGYRTIPLDKLISLKAGDVFEVVFKITVNGSAAFPISESVSLNRELYSEGISYLSYDGKKWVDLYDLEWKYSTHTYNSQVACIKAFTVLNKISTTVKIDVVNSYNPCEITATVTDQYGNLVKSGKVTFTFEGKTVTANVVDGVAKLCHAFKNLKNNEISAKFTSTGYVTSTAKAVVNVDNVSITANDMTVYYGSDIIYKVTLTDDSGNAVSGKEIILDVNGTEYILKTNKNGRVSFNFTLGVGKHTVKLGFNDDAKTMIVDKTITVRTTINPSAYAKYTYGSNYEFTLLDNTGKVLKNTEVSVVIDDVYHVSSDSNGKIVVPIKLAPGKYNVFVVNPSTHEINTKSITVVSRLYKNQALTMYYGAGSSYRVKVLDDHGNIAKNVKVTFKVNGKSYTRTTTSYGNAYLKIGLKPGTYTITATYKGFKVSNKIKVKTTLITKNIAVKKGKTIKFTAKLLSSKGKILKYKKVTFKFKGKTYKVKTNSKGIATLKITKKYKVGKYTITSSYGNLKIKNKITIKK